MAHLDKASIMRLAICYLKVRSLIHTGKWERVYPASAVARRGSDGCRPGVGVGRGGVVLHRSDETTLMASPIADSPFSFVGSMLYAFPLP